MTAVQSSRPPSRRRLLTYIRRTASKVIRNLTSLPAGSIWVPNQNVDWFSRSGGKVVSVWDPLGHTAISPSMTSAGRNVVRPPFALSSFADPPDLRVTARQRSDRAVSAHVRICITEYNYFAFLSGFSKNLTSVDLISKTAPNICLDLTSTGNKYI